MGSRGGAKGRSTVREALWRGAAGAGFLELSASRPQLPFQGLLPMALFQLDDRVPEVHESAYVAESAELIGAIHVEEGASVWSNVTMRGDNEPIRIGRHSNVQEGSVLHTDIGYPLVIGERVTVGHQAMLHGCTIGDGSLIGIQAVVLNGA